jgi:2'-5' RNA ligase
MISRPTDQLEKASDYPSGRGQSAGTAGSPLNDFPDRKTGKPPIATRGEPSTSPDVNASLIMQNMIMNDDDKRWYAKLFKKQAKTFLKPRNTVTQGFDIGLNCGLDPQDTLTESEHASTICSYGIFIQVPIGIIRQLEALYPKFLTRDQIDDSPPHITVLIIGDLDECQVQTAKDICAQVLASFEPFAVEMDGTDHFHNENHSVFHVVIRSDRLTEMRHALKNALECAGIQVNDQHDTFKPHITLSYIDPGQCEPILPVSGSWVVDRAEIWNMSSPVSLRLGHRDCLACASGMCQQHTSIIKTSQPVSVTSLSKTSNTLSNPIIDIIKQIIINTIPEGKCDLLIEPDDFDTKKKKRKRTKKKEVNAIAVGNVQGYSIPLGMSNQIRKMRKKNAKINARAFGNGKIVGKY